MVLLAVRLLRCGLPPHLVQMVGSPASKAQYNRDREQAPRSKAHCNGKLQNAAPFRSESALEKVFGSVARAARVPFFVKPALRKKARIDVLIRYFTYNRAPYKCWQAADVSLPLTAASSGVPGQRPGFALVAPHFSF